MQINKVKNFNYRNGFLQKKLINRKQIFKSIFSNWIFILFSFINLFIPFFATIIASLNKPNGAIDVISVGLSVSFITIFNQFLFLISLCIEFVFKKQQQINLRNKNDRSCAANIMFLLSLISICLFIALSFLYIEFSSIYKNINLSIEKGFKYICIVSPSLIFNGFIYLNIMLAYQEKKWYAILLLFLLFILNLIFIPIIGVVINWNNDLTTFGIGFGILISSMLCFIVILLVNIKHKYLTLRWNSQSIKFFLYKIKNFSLNFLLSTLMKSILIMIIALSMGLSQKDTPPALMVAKIIWYNSLFFCGFFADGLLYTIEYTRISKYPNSDYIIDTTSWNILITLTTIITTIICIIFSASSFSLAKVYVNNQLIEIKNPIGTIWPYGSLSSTEVQKYLWSPEGVYNFKLININNNSINIEKSKSFAILYTSIYHILINSTKIMSFTNIEYNQDFSWKKLISNFIVISFVMIFVVVFSVVPSSKSFIKLFVGIDSFSFALMVISIILFLLTFLGYIKKNKYYKQ